MSGANKLTGSNRWLMLAACAGGLLLSAVACADDRRHDDDHRGDRSNWNHQRGDAHDHDRHYDARTARQGDYRYERYDRRDGHSYRGDYERRDWRYSNGRYWAPPRYRGRECSDRRHYHGVHYHVAARDYYDYYYPRYRYYGSRPYGANASVIITVPLF